MLFFIIYLYLIGFLNKKFKFLIYFYQFIGFNLFNFINFLYLSNFIYFCENSSNFYFSKILKYLENFKKKDFYYYKRSILILFIIIFFILKGYEIMSFIDKILDNAYLKFLKILIMDLI